MIACVQSATCIGITSHRIDIEVDVSFGLPQLSVVGLPDASLKESKERVRAAIKNSGFRFPPEKITINLAPADIRKEGPAFDLAIAIGILAAGDQIPHQDIRNYLFLGELALDGSLRPIKGAIVMAASSKTSETIILPAENAKEAALARKAGILAARSLKEVVEFLIRKVPLERVDFQSNLIDCISTQNIHGLDFSDVRGQRFAKRAIEIAVAGNHNILLIGPPGSGKTMLASRIPSILPPMDFEEALETTKIYSLYQGIQGDPPLILKRPFRSPHHSSSVAALVGGGTIPKPGEISLSHGGVLFLDEFPEFRRDALEALRGPLEDGQVIISRAKMHVTYPSRHMLVAAMNPCPCGYLSDPSRHCKCTSPQIHKYQSKISGPILDRLDLHIEVLPVSIKAINQETPEELSADVRARILQCREIQKKRFAPQYDLYNARMRPSQIKAYAQPDRAGNALMERAMKELRLSARAYYKILKVARTIADLEECPAIGASHIAEAIQYRSLDRQWSAA